MSEFRLHLKNIFFLKNFKTNNIALIYMIFQNLSLRTRMGIVSRCVDWSFRSGRNTVKNWSQRPVFLYPRVTDAQ